jgi:hypothetical protein
MLCPAYGMYPFETEFDDSVANFWLQIQLTSLIIYTNHSSYMCAYPVLMKLLDFA